MFDRIYDHLTTDGFDVYHVGQHQGLCENPYVVIREGGQRPFLTSLAYDTVDIIIFYPVIGRYSDVMPYIKSVMESLKKLKPLRATGDITPIITDDQKKAYTASVLYQIFKRRDF